MNQSHPLTGALALGLLLSGPAPIAAADLPAENHRFDEAWKAAIFDLEGVVTDKEYAILNNLAYHSAVARICENLELDVEKVSKAVNDIVAKNGEQLDDDQKMARQAHVLITLGTSHGIFLAEGSLEKAKFCSDAADNKADPDYSGFWK
jgi:hypothetical protein